MPVNVDKKCWVDNLGRIAGNHTAVCGVLAGFNITVFVLVSGIESIRNAFGNNFTIQVICGLFLLSFFGHITSGVLFSIITESDSDEQKFHFCIASTVYYFSTICSFSALLPLTNLLDYSYLYNFLVCSIFGCTIAGYLAISIPQKELMKSTSSQILTIFSLSVVSAGLLCILGNLNGNNYHLQLFFPFTLPVLTLCCVIIFCFGQLFHIYPKLLKLRLRPERLSKIFTYIITMLVFYIVFFSCFLCQKMNVLV
ncbi:hypothetical protein [Desulfosarcina ovata]|uniref:hypothetical protein n=1 Tax=Desulfosarcina ovata TaxID=83564 RepID=UPI0012D2D09E|nr:hypothetical protein [Desulfosarcina ovata]